MVAYVHYYKLSVSIICVRDKVFAYCNR